MNAAINNFNRAVHRYESLPWAQRRAAEQNLDNSYKRLLHAFGNYINNVENVPLVFSHQLGNFTNLPVHGNIAAYARARRNRAANLIKRQRKVQKLRREITAREALTTKGMPASIKTRILRGRNQT
jgi:hypothetical protein